MAAADGEEGLVDHLIHLRLRQRAKRVEYDRRMRDCRRGLDLRLTLRLSQAAIR